MRLGFIGFGEASFCIAKGLSEYKEIQFWAYDINYQGAKERAREIDNLVVVESIEELLKAVKTIIVAVPGKYLFDAYKEVLLYDIKDYVFVDLSTAFPESKVSVASEINKRSAKYVDVAVLGSIPKLLHKTPMIISGRGCEEINSLLSKYGMDISICGEEAGRASTIKLCRSVFLKGLPALMIETQRVAEKYGVKEEVLSSIYKNLEDQSFESYINRLVEGAYKHKIRQRDELEECVELENAVKVDDFMVSGAIKTFNSLIEDK